jgi:hypothetical protein
MGPILEGAGPLPLERLQVAVGAIAIPADAKIRALIRSNALAAICGYTVQTTRRWLDLAGAPLCPKHGRMDVKNASSRMTL